MEMEKNIACYYNSALSLNLPVSRVDFADLFSLKLGRKQYYFHVTDTPFNNAASAAIALNKYSTTRVLESYKLPVPKSVGITTEEFELGLLNERVRGLKFPVVIKPMAGGSLGFDVLCKIPDIKYLEKLLKSHTQRHQYVLIEEYHCLPNSYRILMFNKRILGVVQRYNASVIGNGKDTIETLIFKENSHRKQCNDALGNISIDEECYICLKEQGFNLSSIPKARLKVNVNYTSNASRGGCFETVEPIICKENKKLFKRVMQALNLKLAGIDLECTDLSYPLETTGGVIIEVNHNPSIRIHEQPMKGKALPVTKVIMRHLIYKHPFIYSYQFLKRQHLSTYVKIGIAIFFISSILYNKILWL